MAGAPKLIYLVTEDWVFLSHRLPMARAARAAGFEVAVASRVAAHGEQIRAEGFTLHPLAWRRRDLGPLAALRAILEIYRLYRREQPDIVHHVALKPMIYGGIAALLARRPAVASSLTGTGYAFAASGFKASLMRLPITLVLRALLARRRSVVVVQNAGHREMLLRMAPAAGSRITVVRGSGIDTQSFRPLPDPESRPVTIGFVARLLADKGVRSLIEAYRLLIARGVPVHLVIAGTPDPENPTSIPEDEVRSWLALPGLSWLGHVSDVRDVWRQAHIAVLPSLHEGLPKSLLEAAACARPIVATDLPGCREIARPGVNALLVPVGDAAALADAIQRLVEDDGLRQRLGAASRRIVDPDLSDVAIGAETVALYQRLLDESGGGQLGNSASVRPINR